MVATDGARRREIGRRIRAARVKAGLSQLEVAERLSVVPTVVSAWEHGEREPLQSTLPRLAGVLQCAPSDLVPEADDA